MNSELTELMIGFLAVFDFAMAFPSVAHGPSFATLRASQALAWLINYVYVSAMYSENHTHYMISHGKPLLSCLLAGVLQGRPISATLLIFAINPFLLHFEELLSPNNLAIVRVCADDIGIAA